MTIPFLFNYNNIQIIAYEKNLKTKIAEAHNRMK